MSDTGDEVFVDEVSRRLVPGLHEGCSEEEYFSAVAEDGSPLTHQSGLKDWGKETASRMLYAVGHPRQFSAPTLLAMEFGSTAHVCLNEPERWKREYFRAYILDNQGVDKKTDKRSKEWKSLVSSRPGQVAVRWEDYDAVEAIRDRVLDTKTGRILFGGEGISELTVVWRDLDTGCIGRPDRWVALDDGTNFLVDFKTLGANLRAGPTDVEKRIAQFSYHMQAAFYLDGLKASVVQAVRTEENEARLDWAADHVLRTRFIFAFAETVPPYDVGFYELDEDAILRGRLLYKQSLRRMLRAKEENHYPGYPDSILTVGLPRWMKDSDVLLEGD